MNKREFIVKKFVSKILKSTALLILFLIVLSSINGVAKIRSLDIELTQKGYDCSWIEGGLSATELGISSFSSVKAVNALTIRNNGTLLANVYQISSDANAKEAADAFKLLAISKNHIIVEQYLAYVIIGEDEKVIEDCLNAVKNNYSSVGIFITRYF